MHGKKDKIVPFKMGLEIYEKLNGQKFKYFNEQDDHMMEYNPDLVRAIENFINQEELISIMEENKFKK